VNNRIDHCSFEGKGNGGATLVVWLGAENTGKHRIDHNYFGPRPVLGRNGGETIRIGDSRTSMQSAQCIVERNLFERCDGEVECVSNKSCDNLYRENTFRAVVGTLTLRHGNRCTVEGNVFLGDFVKRTGGIRVIGEDHTVRGNHLQALTGDEARAALCFMMGVSGSAAHEYFQVKRARIEGNTIVDCKVPVVIGLRDHAKASLPPDDVVFVDNRVVSDKATIIDARCSIEGVRWSGNIFHGRVLGIPDREGIRWKAPEVKGVRPLDRAEVGPIWLR
jgi:poly(beta-D-mannuronate) lyase